MNYLPELKNKEYLTSQDALRVRFLLTQLRKPKSDKRKLRIKKKQYIQWYQMVDSLCKAGMLDPMLLKQEHGILGYYKQLFKHGTSYNFSYIRLRTHQKLEFLHSVDNAFLIILANLGYYPNSAGTKLIRIAQMHPVQFESTVKKMKEQGYQLPQQFKPIKLNIE